MNKVPLTVTNSEIIIYKDYEIIISTLDNRSFIGMVMNTSYTDIYEYNDKNMLIDKLKELIDYMIKNPIKPFNYYNKYQKFITSIFKLDFIIENKNVIVYSSKLNQKLVDNKFVLNIEKVQSNLLKINTYFDFFGIKIFKKSFQGIRPRYYNIPK